MDEHQQLSSQISIAAAVILGIGEMTEKACENCGRIVEDGHICPNCGGSSFSESWRGYVIIIDSRESMIAEKMGANTSGRYALSLQQGLPG